MFPFPHQQMVRTRLQNGIPCAPIIFHCMMTTRYRMAILMRLVCWNCLCSIHARFFQSGRYQGETPFWRLCGSAAKGRLAQASIGRSGRFGLYNRPRRPKANRRRHQCPQRAIVETPLSGLRSYPSRKPFGKTVNPQKHFCIFRFFLSAHVTLTNAESKSLSPY